MGLACGTPTNLKTQNLKSVVVGYPQNLMNSRSSGGKHILKIWSKSINGFRLWNTNKLRPKNLRSSLKSSFPVSFLGNIMEPAELIKNLGAILDAENSMQRHMANLCRICHYHLRELRRVRRYLNHETAVKVAKALASSRLDYSNSPLYHTKKAYTVRLQRVQNALCRTVYKLNKFSHVTPFMHKLHWLPIHYHILFKHNLLTYKALHFSQPPYLSSLIRWSDLTWGNRLSISLSKLNKCSGLRRLHSSCSHKLPQAIRTLGSISGFRKQLKTYLFRLAYPPP